MGSPRNKQRGFCLLDTRNVGRGQKIDTEGDGGIIRKKLFRCMGKVTMAGYVLITFNYQMLMQAWYLFTVKLDGKGTKSGVGWGVN